jgi:ABC-2 type transport system permease protein
MLKRIFSKQNKALLSELVRTDFKLRYQGSVLGYLWSLLRPLFLFGILYVVFGVILQLGKGVPNFPVYLLLGVVLWEFFTEATKQGMSAIVNRGSLLRKINFPKYIVVFSATISAFINMLINLVVVGGFIVFTGADVQWQAVFILPLLILELYILALAVAFLLGTVNVRYRDIGHIWDIVLRAGFYATAIIYPISLVAERSELAAKLMILSPVAQIIQDARYLLTTPVTMTLESLYGTYLIYLLPLGFIAVLSVVASLYFKKRSKYFAEDL